MLRKKTYLFGAGWLVCARCRIWHLVRGGGLFEQVFERMIVIVIVVVVVDDDFGMKKGGRH